MTTGLYHPDEFRDNCGFGLIAHMKGEASHKLLQTAIESLTCMTHRGGIAADGKTGDGCGLLLQSPKAFLNKAAEAAFGKKPPGGSWQSRGRGFLRAWPYARAYCLLVCRLRRPLLRRHALCPGMRPLVRGHACTDVGLSAEAASLAGKCASLLRP